MKRCYLLVFALFLACSSVEGQDKNSSLEKAMLKPYMFFNFEKDSPDDHNYGAFSYTNIHNTLPADAVGPYYQSGLFHTWYRPNKIYGLEDYSRDKYGYHCMEGGVGYKPYLRFRSRETPQKFTTGAVAGGFGSFSNGPGVGVPSFKRSQNSPTLGWEKNLGRYGAAQLSNRLLCPLDGIGFERGTNNKMFGYGYCALPLTEPKSRTAGHDIPTGNHCWTLFLNSSNFRGPVCFFTPYHWSKYSIKKKNVQGMCLDNSLLKVNSTYQRETNNIPAKKWTASNGDVYYRVIPYYLPVDADEMGRFGSKLMTIDSTMWNKVEDWFDGGMVASPSFGSVGKEIHERTFNSGNLAYKLDKKTRVQNFCRSIRDRNDPSAATFKWNMDLMKKVDGAELVQIPEYYLLKKDEGTAIAIPSTQVPVESGLHEINFPEDSKNDFDFSGFLQEPITTPLNPGYRHTDDVVTAWKTPGPIAGPFVVDLSDGSQAVYYWYKFCEQPAILNSFMDKTERELIQKRIELLHANWSIDDHYVPDPKQPLATIDKGIIVTPPQGLEIGFVPICVHQQQASQRLPDFPKIDRRKTPSRSRDASKANVIDHSKSGAAKLKVYILAGQSNMVGQGVVTGKDIPGTLEFCIANGPSEKYRFLTDPTGQLAEQSDVWIYYERDGELLTGNLSPRFGRTNELIGPELSFGEQMQKQEEQRILLIKTAWGGKSLGKDFRPPSAGGESGDYYKELVRISKSALGNLHKHFPEHNEADGYEIAGLFWHQGWNDHVNKQFTKDYARNFACLVRDLRKDLGENFPVVLATTGMPTKREAKQGKNSYKPIEKAQLAIADKEKFPQLVGNVAVVDTKPFWKEISKSPVPSGNQHYHWNKSAEIYMDIGFSAAKAFEGLKKVK